jgi:hypothetical protein
MTWANEKEIGVHRLGFRAQGRGASNFRGVQGIQEGACQVLCLISGCTLFPLSPLRLLITANIVPSSSILVALMMEVIRSSETLILTRVTRHNNSDDGIFIVTGVDVSNLT